MAELEEAPANGVCIKGPMPGPEVEASGLLRAQEDNGVLPFRCSQEVLPQCQSSSEIP